MKMVYLTGPRCCCITSSLIALAGILIVGVIIITLLELQGKDSRNTKQHEKPNVIFILLDDWGHNDVSWNNPDVRTPNIEKLGRSGIILDRNYVCPVCGPSRAAFLTGKYVHRLGLQNGNIRANSAGFIPENEKLIGERFKEIGYATHMLGKWHEGFCHPRYLPTRRGFDTFYGAWNGAIDQYKRCHGSSIGNDTAFDWHDQERLDSSFQNVHVTDLLKHRAVRIIENARKDEPFFMYLSFFAPHVPIQVPERYLRYYSHINDAWRRDYLAMVTHADDAVGEVVEALKSQGLFDNTIITLSSDNGGEKGPGNNFPFRGAKGSSYEGGTRVPGLITGPKSIIKKHGYISQGRIHITDWVPTLISLAAGYQTSTQEEGLDGVDQRRMIVSGEESARREVVYGLDTKLPFSPFGHAIISYDNYKLIMGSAGMVDGWEQDGNIGYVLAEGVSVIMPRLGPTNNFNAPTCAESIGFPYNLSVLISSSIFTGTIPRDSVRLYDIEADPEERFDLANQLPWKVQELKDRLDVHLDREVQPQPRPQVPLDVAQRNQAWVTGWC